MILPDLMHAMNSAGITLAVDGDLLRVKAPAGALTLEIREALGEHRATIRQAVGLAPEPTPKPDPEREAIQWVESLSEAEGQSVVDQAGAGLTAVVNEYVPSRMPPAGADPEQWASGAWLADLYDHADLSEAGNVVGEDFRQWPISATVHRLVNEWPYLKTDADRDRWHADLRAFHDACDEHGTAWFEDDTVDRTRMATDPDALPVHWPDSWAGLWPNVSEDVA